METQGKTECSCFRPESDFSAIVSGMKRINSARFSADEVTVENQSQSNSASDRSSATSLSRKLENIPEPSLEECLASFNRRLHYDELKSYLYLKSQESYDKIEEQEERQALSARSRTSDSSKLKNNQRMTELSSRMLRALHRRSSAATSGDVTIQSVPVVTDHQKCFSEPTKSPNRFAKSSYSAREDTTDNSRTSSSSSRSCNQTYRNYAIYRTSQLKNDSTTRYCGLPVLKNSDARDFRDYQSKYRPIESTIKARSLDSDREKSISYRGRERLRRKSSTLDSHCKLGLELPRIESKISSASQDSDKSREEFVQLNNQIASLLQKIGPDNAIGHYKPPPPTKYLGDRVKPLCLRENPRSKLPSPICTAQRDGIPSSLSTLKDAKRDTRLSYLDHFGVSGYYTDRPKSSRKICPVHSRSIDFYRSAYAAGAKPEVSEPAVFVPALDIRSVSTSNDSSETYKVFSTKPNAKTPQKARSFGSSSSSREIGGSDFVYGRRKYQEFSSTARNQQSSRQSSVDKSSQTSTNSSKLRRSHAVSRIPVKIPTDLARTGTGEPKKFETCSESSQVSEYETNTVVVISTEIRDPPEEESIPERVTENLVTPKNAFANVNVTDSSTGDGICTAEYAVQKESGLKVENSNFEDEDATSSSQSGKEKKEMANGSDTNFPNPTKVQDEKKISSNADQKPANNETKLGNEENGEGDNGFGEKEAKRRILLSLVRSESAMDVPRKDRLDRKRILSSSVSTSRLSLYEAKRDPRDRFPFTISRTTSRNSARFKAATDCDFNRQIISGKVRRKIEKPYDLETHPSMIRLVFNGREPTATEIISFVANDSQREARHSGTWDFIHRLKSRKLKKDEDRTELNVVGAIYKNSDSESCDKSDRYTASNYKFAGPEQREADTRELSEKSSQIQRDNWVRETDYRSNFPAELLSEGCKGQSDPQSVFMIKERKSDLETGSENKTFEASNVANDVTRRKDVEEVVGTGCACFKWCRF